MEFFQTVLVQATNDVEIGRKVRAIKEIAREIENDQPDIPTVPLPPSPPAAKAPYFDIGEATGKPGETIGILVEAGCPNPITGFHIGGGVGLDSSLQGAGYGKFKAVGVTLGKYLMDYITSQGLTDFWKLFQFASWESHQSLPEEWWEYALGFFSLSQERIVPPIAIPSGTELFTLQIEILPKTARGEYELTCKNEYYFTHARQRRRQFLFTNERQGFTNIVTIPGKITVA